MYTFNSKELFSNAQNMRNAQTQFADVQGRRSAFNKLQDSYAGMVDRAQVGNAAARIPAEVYREMDAQAESIRRANNLTLLNDIMGLSKTLPVGKVLHEYRQSSDSGNVTNSIGGQVPAKLDKATYTYDGDIIIINSDAYGRGWREWQGQQSEGFDGLIDDNANSLRALQDDNVAQIYDGKDVTFKGVKATGIKNNANTALVDLGAGGLNVDFTSSSLTAENARNALIQVLYTLRTTNNVTQDVTVYISREIEENWQRYYSSEDIAFGTLLENFKRIAGIADIKTDAHLTGNEMCMVALSSMYIQPLVGMATNTVPMMRTQPFDNYNFLVWNALGLQIRADADGRVGVLYAREA